MGNACGGGKKTQVCYDWVVVNKGLRCVFWVALPSVRTIVIRNGSINGRGGIADATMIKIGLESVVGIGNGKIIPLVL